MRIIVCLKQVVDPLIPVGDLRVDPGRMKLRDTLASPPVINGYDEQALEAALRLKEDWPSAAGPCEVICLAAGDQFDLDVMKRALAAGADELVLVQDAALDTWDALFLASTLAAAIGHLGGADLVLCGRQASDWDHAQVPLILAEQLGWPCLTLAAQVGLHGERVQVERVLGDGTQVMEARLPAVVTVTSELGELRYPTARARLLAARRQPRLLALKDLGVAAGAPPRVELLDLALLKLERACQLVGGADGAETGRRLAETLLEAGLVATRGA
jgi:electron transfer flavoprotein beta subunit